VRVTTPGSAPSLVRAVLAVGAVLVVGVLGYAALGFTWLDAMYQTVTTVTTIGFREVEPFGTAEKVFTMAYVLTAVGVVLYSLTSILGAVVEGHLFQHLGRRRMDREITRLRDHAVVCGWGRVGRAAAHQLHKSGMDVVVVDTDLDRLADCPYPVVAGDASRDEVLVRCGILQARTLVATLDTDAASLFVTITARALHPELVIISRVRTDDAEQKFLRAGADRVVNPQRIGGNRVAAFALLPHVVDFLDVAMHEEDVEFRLEEITVAAGSPLDGSTVRAARDLDGGALLLSLRAHGTGRFVTNPPGASVLGPGDVVIAIGTTAELARLRQTGLTAAG
jgi:voltage-gated potassium channel